MSSSAEPSWLGKPAIAGLHQQAETRVSRCSLASSHRRVEVYDTLPFGSDLVQGGAGHRAIGDALTFLEMLAHRARMASLPSEARVAGSDHGSAPALGGGVYHATRAEIDCLVVDTCIQYSPQMASTILALPPFTYHLVEASATA